MSVRLLDALYTTGRDARTARSTQRVSAAVGCIVHNRQGRKDCQEHPACQCGCWMHCTQPAARAPTTPYRIAQVGMPSLDVTQLHRRAFP